MANQENRPVGEVLIQYREECVLFDLLTSRYRRELAKHVLVLSMYLKKEIGLPMGIIDGMVTVVKQILLTSITQGNAASYLDRFVEKADIALSLMKIPPSPLPDGEPDYLRYFEWSRNARRTIRSMAAEYDTGIPSLIFNDKLRTEYLLQGSLGSTLLLSPAATEIARVREAIELERTLEFAYLQTYGQGFLDRIVTFIVGCLGDGCVVEEKMFNKQTPMITQHSQLMVTGRISFRAPASYLQYALSSISAEIPCQDGRHFFLRYLHT